MAYLDPAAVSLHGSLCSILSTRLAFVNSYRLLVCDGHRISCRVCSLWRMCAAMHTACSKEQTAFHNSNRPETEGGYCRFVL